MNKSIAIIAGEPNSISSEIIFKSWKLKNHFIKYNLPNKVSSYFSKKDLQNLILYMKKDKKNTSNLINLILMKKIGKIKLNLNFKDKKIYNFLKEELIN